MNKFNKRLLAVFLALVMAFANTSVVLANGEFEQAASPYGLPQITMQTTSPAALTVDATNNIAPFDEVIDVTVFGPAGTVGTSMSST